MSKDSSRRELMLRTSDANRQSHGGFRWPESGPVEAPDWDPCPVCGNGLHGAARGEGNGTLFNWSAEAVWQVVEYDPAEAIDLGGKIKIPRGIVLYSGRRKEATRIIQERYPNAAVIGGIAAVGDYGTAKVGCRGTATAGAYGTATAGVQGTAIVGANGTAKVGGRGTATAGYCGIAMAGVHGIIQIAHFQRRRQRILTGYIGEGGLLPMVRYRVEGGKFVEADNEC